MPELRHVRGLAELEAVLKKLPPEISQRVLNNALRKGAQPILDQARENAPVGQESKGRLKLRRSKKGKVSVKDYGKLKLNLRIANVPAKRTAHSASVVVSVGRAYWGMFLEFGTRFMAARPWFRPAFEASKTDALKAFGHALGEGIEKAALKLAGPYRKSGLKRR